MKTKVPELHAELKNKLKFKDTPAPWKCEFLLASCIEHTWLKKTVEAEQILGILKQSSSADQI